MTLVLRPLRSVVRNVDSLPETLRRSGHEPAQSTPFDGPAPVPANCHRAPG